MTNRVMFIQLYPPDEWVNNVMMFGFFYLRSFIGLHLQQGHEKVRVMSTRHITLYHTCSIIVYTLFLDHMTIDHNVFL